jgi:hypothetical protein
MNMRYRKQTWQDPRGLRIRNGTQLSWVAKGDWNRWRVARLDTVISGCFCSISFTKLRYNPTPQS